MTLEIALNAANAVLPAASEGGEESGNMLLPETSDLVWGTVAFVIIAVVLLRYALPRFTKVLDERTRRIEEGLELADKAKEDQTNAELKAARLVEDARRDAAKIREDAQAQAQEIVAAAREAAQGEAGKALDAAERQIQADKQAAQISLRTDVGLLASSLAEKIVGEQLKDTELSARVIDRFLDDLEAAPSGEPSGRQSVAPTGEGAVR
jgi:ATP synthase F0, B subunit